MTDISITAANVLSTGSADTETGIAGASVTAGQVVYKEAATGQFKLADADHATAEVRAFYGIALHAAAAGQPLKVHRGGNITIGATVVAGTAYYVSDTAGGIKPSADLGAGDEVNLIGHAISATQIAVRPHNTGVTL